MLDLYVRANVARLRAWVRVALKISQSLSRRGPERKRKTMLGTEIRDMVIKRCWSVAQLTQGHGEIGLWLRIQRRCAYP